MSIKETAERGAAEVCSYDWYDCTQPEDAEQMKVGVAAVIERAIREAAQPLVEALGALGAIGGGYCFCSRDRDDDKREHEPECSEARRLLAEWRASK